MKKKYSTPSVACFGDQDPDVCTLSKVTVDLGDGYGFSGSGGGDIVQL